MALAFRCCPELSMTIWSAYIRLEQVLSDPTPRPQVRMASHLAHWTGSIASTKKLSFIWDPFHLQTYSFLVWKPLKNKYFIFVLFRNWPISTFPYVKLKEKWRKNGRLCAENCLNLFKNDLNSLLNKHWQGPRTLRIPNCSAQYRCAYKTWSCH